jgi:hypothetical protein
LLLVEVGLEASIRHFTRGRRLHSEGDAPACHPSPDSVRKRRPSTVPNHGCPNDGFLGGSHVRMVPPAWALQLIGAAHRQIARNGQEPPRNALDIGDRIPEVFPVGVVGLIVRVPRVRFTALI